MSTSILATLKLTVARKSAALPDVIKRRNKLLQKLLEQQELSIALVEGRHYAPKRLRSFKSLETGDRLIKEVPIRIKPWFWVGEKGETLLAVKYGNRQIELSKGKSAIDCGESKNLTSVLEALIAAVRNGELDAQIESASSKLREGFKR